MRALALPPHRSAFSSGVRFALALGVLASAATAQPVAPPGEPFPPLGDPAVDARLGPPPVDALSDAATASLLTMLPGEEVYALFGHSALRIHDPATGLDRAYNYGTFDFRQPFFVLRFARGELDYVLDTAPFPDEVARYEWLRRPMIEQRLALDAATVRALYRRLETNALPEHRAYRYRFFYDNCSTRLLDVVDAARRDVGRTPVALPDAPQTASFRDLIRPYVAADPLLWVGMSTGLGTPADETASTRQRAFLPLELLRLMDTATLDGRPLVAARDTVFWVEGAGMPRRTFPWPSALTWGLLALGVALTIAERRRAPGRLVRTLDAALLAGTGLMGLALLLLWFATAHDVTGPNLHLLWAWPTHLGAAVLVARGRGGRGFFIYLASAAVVAAPVALAWPLWPQGMPAAVLPLVLLLALRCGAEAWHRRTRVGVAA